MLSNVQLLRILRKNFDRSKDLRAATVITLRRLAYSRGIGIDSFLNLREICLIGKEGIVIVSISVPISLDLR